MSSAPKIKSQKSRLQALGLLSITVPMLAMSLSNPAAAQSSNARRCIDVKGVGICAEQRGEGYDIFAEFGPITSQKQYVGRDGACATFGTVSFLGSHAQVQGCLKTNNPVRLEGKAEACGLGNCTSKAFTLNLSGTTNTNPNTNPTLGKYQLFWDGVQVGMEPSWTREQAVANLEENKRAYPNKKVEGYFNGVKVGYELFWDNVRVGFEPSWNRTQAIANLEENKRAYPDKKVEGFLNGEKVGYQLFWDGVQVGFEPGWTREQAVTNLEQNKQAYPNKKVEGLFNGQKVGYELYWDGVRVGFEPSWNRAQAITNLQQNKQAYPNKKIEGLLNGQTVGYELYWDGVRVGFEPGWTREQAVANLQQNRQAYPDKKVKGLFNGEQLP